MTKYIMRSANHDSALMWPAAAIMLEPGRLTFPNSMLARRRAGSVQDLDRARELRISGDKARARDHLAFARDARLVLSH